MTKNQNLSFIPHWRETAKTLRVVLIVQLLWVIGAIMWNVVGVQRIEQSLQPFGPTASLTVAIGLGVFALLLALGLRLSAILYAVLSLIGIAAAGMAILGAFSHDPSLWPSEALRYGGVALNAVGLVSCILAVATSVAFLLRRHRAKKAAYSAV